MENPKKRNVYLVNSREQALLHTTKECICDCKGFLNTIYDTLFIGIKEDSKIDKACSGLYLGQIFSDIFGVPMIISSKYIAKWWELFNGEINEDFIKYRLDIDINKFIRNWNRKCVLWFLDNHTDDNLYVILTSGNIEPLNNINIIDLRSENI